MKKFLTAYALFVFAITATAQENDNALLNSLTEKCPFGQNAAADNWSNLGDASAYITLRGIICCGDIWYFSIYNAQTNSCSWLALKDAENLMPYKAEFFDDENNTLLLAANGKNKIRLPPRFPIWWRARQGRGATATAFSARFQE